MIRTRFRILHKQYHNAYIYMTTKLRFKPCGWRLGSDLQKKGPMFLQYIRANICSFLHVTSQYLESHSLEGHFARATAVYYYNKKEEDFIFQKIQRIITHIY